MRRIIFVGSNEVIVKVLLPRKLHPFLPEAKASLLFEFRDQTQKIAAVIVARDDKVKVIRHEHEDSRVASVSMKRFFQGCYRHGANLAIFKPTPAVFGVDGEADRDMTPVCLRRQAVFPFTNRVVWTSHGPGSQAKACGYKTWVNRASCQCK